jgi:hypothetical protein
MAIKDEIQATIDTNDVVLFMKGTPDFPQCGFSGRVVQILNALGVSYEPVDCLANDPPALHQGRIHRRLRHCPGNVSIGRARGAFGGKGDRVQAAGQGMTFAGMWYA